ncbi:ATP-binding cassette domain-containing protein [Christiangramia echinicola]|uniref:ABC transporter n=1 Tax=Christiangramia echinicola TaxID=279359 RepID=A0A1H1QNM5_9FLAO|nr:ATP-binding cassette domain-containing protein [Christiangramia echinicola]SDS25070.1 ABC transporter [Christiangramia echinicola]
MNWIEIMGPSGIGKSTLLNSLSKFRNNRNDWVYLNEGLEILAKNNLDSSISDKILKYYLKQKVLNTKKNVLVKSILDGKRAYLENGKNYSALVESYLKYHFYFPSSNALEKTYRISLFKTIIEQMCTFDFYNFRIPVLLDEGPLNHHPDLKQNDWEKKQITPKGIIFCHLDIDENFDRVKRREKNGRLVPLHEGMEDYELKESIKSNYDLYLEKRDLLIAEGIPYFDIDLKKVQNIQLLEVKRFIKNIMK